MHQMPLCAEASLQEGTLIKERTLDTSIMILQDSVHCTVNWAINYSMLELTSDY